MGPAITMPMSTDEFRRCFQMQVSTATVITASAGDLSIVGGGREESSTSIDFRLPARALCVEAICHLPLGSRHSLAEAWTFRPSILID
jgi:hypothetical protein